MGVTKVPGSVVSGRSVFPAGHFAGTISKIEENTNQAGTFGSIRFQMIKNTAIDAEKEPGGRIHFCGVATWMQIKDKKGKEVEIFIDDVDPEDENAPFGLVQAIGQWAQLAVIFNQATVTEDGGVEFNDGLEAFIEQFKSGEWDGEEIEYIVSHSPRKDKETKKVIKGAQPYVNTTFVLPDEDDENEEKEETASEPEAEKEDEKSAAKSTRGSGNRRFKRKS